MTLILWANIDNSHIPTISIILKTTKKIQLIISNMYGGMGGGGNAWMKIMGINSSEIGKRQAAKEKGKGVDKDGNKIPG